MLPQDPGKLQWEQVVVQEGRLPCTLTLSSPSPSPSSSDSSSSEYLEPQQQQQALPSQPGDELPAPRAPHPRGPGGSKPTDLVLLSSRPVADVREWWEASRDSSSSSTPPHSNDGQECLAAALGLVTKLEEDGREGVKVTLSVRYSPLYRRLCGSTGGAEAPRWYLAVVGTAATTRRMTSALQAIAVPPFSSSRVLHTVLHPGAARLAAARPRPAAQAQERQAGLLGWLPPALELFLGALLSWAVQQYCAQRGLNASQAAAVQRVLQALPSPDRPRQGAKRQRPKEPQRARGGAAVQLVQGPPGTGKTSTIGGWAQRPEAA